MLNNSFTNINAYSFYENKRNNFYKIYRHSSETMPEIKDEEVNLIITSPPYLNIKNYFENENFIDSNDIGTLDTLEKWSEEIEKVLKECYRVLQSGRKMFINVMNPLIKKDGSFECIDLHGEIIKIAKNIGFIYKRDIIWSKTNGPRAHFGTFPYPGNILINSMHEFIIEFEKPGDQNKKKYAHVSDEAKRLSIINKEFWKKVKKSDVWVLKPVDYKNKIHPAPFPIELPNRLIRLYSFVDEIVLDPFLGSGTTAFAAYYLKRSCYGYEIYDKYFQNVINFFETNTFFE